MPEMPDRRSGLKMRLMPQMPELGSMQETRPIQEAQSMPNLPAAS